MEENEPRKEVKLAILAPVHRRHRFLSVAFDQFRKIPDVKLRIYYFRDRTTPQVEEVIAGLQRDHRQVVKSVEMPWHIVEGTYGDFPKAWDWQLQYVNEDWSPDWVGIWDDDMILTGAEEARNLMVEHDLVYGEKLFLWDSVEIYNARVHHNSVVFFRHQRGDRFHKKDELQVHAPKGVHDNPASRRVNMKAKVLDYGFLSGRDRKCVFDREKRTGKIDGFTLPLVSDPVLKTLPDALLAKSRQFQEGFLPE